MDWESISESDYVGKFYIWASGAQGWLDYYETIDRLRPLFERPQFRNLVSGCYVNRIRDDTTDNEDTVRLTYFVKPELISAAIQEIEAFLKKNELHEVYARKHPDIDSLLKLRYRQFLTLETRIGLELMEKNPVEARLLLAKYRWQVFRTRRPRPPHFKPTFERYSATYINLSPKDKSFFWQILGDYNWAHHLVNLVLGWDWPYEKNYEDNFGEPLSIQLINKKRDEIPKYRIIEKAQVSREGQVD